MKEVATLILGVSALLLSGETTAQTFKCTDATGKITYSGKKCSDLGMKDAGEVKDRINVNPAYRPSGRESGSGREGRSTPPAPTAAPQNSDTPAAAAEPAQAERRCFTVRTAKGNVTRCNDKPDE
jgi:hypothetical protein